MKLHTWTNH